MTEGVDNQLIHRAVGLLEFKGPFREEGEFVDLHPTVPDDYAVFLKHDVTLDTPPPGVAPEAYDALRLRYRIMKTALDHHEQEVAQEEVERFRERHWSEWAGGYPGGATGLRRLYLDHLTAKVVREFGWYGDSALVEGDIFGVAVEEVSNLVAERIKI